MITNFTIGHSNNSSSLVHFHCKQTFKKCPLTANIISFKIGIEEFQNRIDLMISTV